MKLYIVPTRGGMGERLIPAVLKTVVPERVPGVRIPLPPPDPFTIKAFQKHNSFAINSYVGGRRRERTGEGAASHG